jgi:hypothetical protein
LQILKTQKTSIDIRLHSSKKVIHRNDETNSS